MEEKKPRIKKRFLVINEGKTFAKAMSERNLATNASSIAFYFFISLIPMLVLLCSELPFTGISKYELTRVIRNMTPEMVHDLLTSMIYQAYSSRIGIFSLSMVLLIWSSSKGMLALIRSLDKVYQVKDSRSYIRMVFFSIMATIILLIGISILLVIYTKELSAEELLRASLKNQTFVERIVQHSKDLNSLLFMTTLFSAVYKFAPAGKRKFIYQIPGAIFSSVSITVFSIYFAAYSSGTNVYNSFYGSLTSVTIFLVWIYSCIDIFLIGGVMNSHYQKRIEKLIQKIKDKREANKIQLPIHKKDKTTISGENTNLTF